jgi:hypothetical protein
VRLAGPFGCGTLRESCLPSAPTGAFGTGDGGPQRNRWNQRHDAPVPHGTLVATASDSTWQSEMIRYVDVAGGNDYELSRKFVVDELKVCNGVTFAPLGG